MPAVALSRVGARVVESGPRGLRRARMDIRYLPFLAYRHSASRRRVGSPNSGKRAAVAARDVEDDLAAGGPALQDLVCLGGCRQREQVADHWLHGAIVRQCREGPGALPVVLDQHAMEADVGIEQGVQVEHRGGDGRDPARPVPQPGRPSARPGPAADTAAAARPPGPTAPGSSSASRSAPRSPSPASADTTDAAPGSAAPPHPRSIPPGAADTAAARQSSARFATSSRTPRAPGRSPGSTTPPPGATCESPPSHPPTAPASLPGSARARLERGGSVFGFRHRVSFHVPPTPLLPDPSCTVRASLKV